MPPTPPPPAPIARGFPAGAVVTPHASGRDAGAPALTLGEMLAQKATLRKTCVDTKARNFGGLEAVGVENAKEIKYTGFTGVYFPSAACAPLPAYTASFTHFFSVLSFFSLSFYLSFFSHAYLHTHNFFFFSIFANLLLSYTTKTTFTQHIISGGGAICNCRSSITVRALHCQYRRSSSN